MLITEEAKARIDKLPLVLKIACNTLIDCLERLVNGSCDEEEVTELVGTMNETSKGRYGEDDVMDYDKTGKALGFGTTNRVQMKKLLDRNGIKQVTIRNTKIGFPRTKIMALKRKQNL